MDASETFSKSQSFYMPVYMQPQRKLSHVFSSLLSIPTLNPQTWWEHLDLVLVPKGLRCCVYRESTRDTRREEKNSSHSDLAETHVMLKLQHGRKFSHQNSFHPCLTKATPWAYLSHIDPNHGEEFSHTNTPLLNANKHRAWHLLPALLLFQLHPATKFLKPRYSGKQHPRAICIAEKHWN